MTFVVTLLHFLLCRNDRFFRRFGFLLPEDTSYYIFVQNKPCSDLSKYKLKIETPSNSEYILSDPVLKDCILEYDIESIARGEIKHVFLLLHINKTINNIYQRELKFPQYNEFNKKLKIWWSSSDHYPDHINEQTGWLEKLYLAISKNVILYICTIILYLFILIGLLYFNPPLNVVADPHQIAVNMTNDQEKIIDISIKNIGCELKKLNLSISPEIKLLDDKWNSNDEIVLTEGAIEHIRLRIDNLPVGEYTGIITLKGNCSRSLFIMDSLNETETKTIASISYNIQII